MHSREADPARRGCGPRCTRRPVPASRIGFGRSRQVDGADQGALRLQGFERQQRSEGRQAPGKPKVPSMGSSTQRCVARPSGDSPSPNSSPSNGHGPAGDELPDESLGLADRSG